MKWFILVMGIFTNASASVLVKIAVTKLSDSSPLLDPISLITNWPFVFGLLLYAMTFLFYALALVYFPLNIAHPVFTSGAIVCVSLISFFVLKEQFFITTGIGILFIVGGLLLITYKAS